MIKMELKQLVDPAYSVLVIGPHPDDIEFSTGRLIMRRKGKNTFAIVMTDGRRGQEGTPYKKTYSQEDYAKIRMRESIKALKELNVDMNNMFFFEVHDQELVNNPYVIDKSFLMFRKLNPDIILIPPFEGAHPDHDACHLFCRVAANNYGKGTVLEYGSYNNYEGKFRVQEFIPLDTKEMELMPTPNEQKRWQNIMKIFKTQLNQQRYYVPKSYREIFRACPKYDYSQLPYASTQANIIRYLMKNIYPIANKIIPIKDKLYYETWTKINPVQINKKLDSYIKEYGL